MGEQSVVLSPMLVEQEKRDELTSHLFITDIGYYPKAERHHRIRLKAIDQYVLIYCVDGNGWYQLNGYQYPVSKNQFFILPAGQPHIYGASAWWTIYWVHFRGQHASIFAEGMQKPNNINVTLNSRITDRISIFEEILTTLQTGQGIEDLRYASSLLHHFLASMRYLQQFRRSKRLELTNQTVVDAAIHFMQENIGRRIRLADVVRYVGYSQSQFSLLFRQQKGQSPLAFFNRLKIEHACRLLRETDMKISQICYMIGIEDPLYFSRLFSKTMGLSPTDYRKRRDEQILPHAPATRVGDEPLP